MISAFRIIAFFAIGIVIGALQLVPDSVNVSGFSGFALLVVIFLVGISIGADNAAWNVLRHAKHRVVLVPLAIVVGSLAAVAVASLFVNISLRDALAVGSGLGYYSFAGVYVGRVSGEALGTVVLIANLIREVFTIMATPLLVRYFGKLSPMATGAASSMDTTLPIITEATGKDFAMVSLFTGVVITVLVPFLVSFVVRL